MHLPFDSDPRYKTYLDSTYPLSITGARYDLRVLYASYYTNVRMSASDKAARLAFTPWLRPEDFRTLGLLDTEPLVPDWPKISERELARRVLDALSEGWYIYSTVDECYVEGTAAYLQLHFKHPALICGYSQGARTLLWATYFKDSRGAIVYDCRPVRFSGGMKAMSPRRLQSFRGMQWTKPIKIRVRNDVDITLNRETARTGLRNYCAGRGGGSFGEEKRVAQMSSDEWRIKREQQSFLWGMETYDGLMARILESVAEGRGIDLRNTRAFWEHKRITSENFSVWEGGAGASPQETRTRYAPVLEWAEKVHMRAIRHNSDWKARRTKPARFAALFDEAPAIKALDRPVIERIADTL